MSSGGRARRALIGLLAFGMPCNAVMLMLMASVALGAGPEKGETSSELRFAVRLCEMGYGALAVEQLQRTRTRDFLPADVRHEATELLAQTYRLLGEQAAQRRDFTAKRENFENAVTEYDRYLEEAGADIKPQEKADLQYDEALICSELGQDDVAGLEGAADAAERQQYGKSAIRWFAKAENGLAEAAAYYLKERELWSEATDRVGKLRYHEVRERAGQVQLERARTLYQFGGAFTEEGQQDERKVRLLEAIDILQNDLVNEYGIFDVKYTAERLTGMCYERMGEYEKAIEYLQKALSVQPTPDTIWIVRLARYNLAQTYNDWGENSLNWVLYDPAMVQADALLSEVSAALDTRGGPDLEDMYCAALIEKSRALVLKARFKKNRAAEPRNRLAGRDNLEAQRDFEWAVDIIRSVAARTRSRWHRNAKVWLDRWVKEAPEFLGRPIVLRPDINTWSSRGLKLLEEGQYLDYRDEKGELQPGAIAAFEEAIAVGDPGVHGSTLMPECWYKMGLCYYNLSRPEHTGGRYDYYYEAALCFEKIARDHARAAFAADAAYTAQQLYGAVFRLTRDRLQNSDAGVSRDDLLSDGRRYFEAIRLMKRVFPNDVRSQGLVFQAAEIARALEEFEQASNLYAQVAEDRLEYHKARYYAALCLYLEALKLHDGDSGAASAERITRLLDGARDLYREHMRWFDDRRELLGRELLNEVNPWVLRSRIGYGKVMVHDAWGLGHDPQDGAVAALEEVVKVEPLHFADGLSPELVDKSMPEALLVTVQAYRILDELPKAEELVKELVTRFGERSTLTSRAASLVGFAYLRKRRELESASMPEAQVRPMASKAAEYLALALKYDPDQDLGVYLDVGGELYRAGEYEDAVDLFEKGLERFPPLPSGYSDLQIQALDGLERSYIGLAGDSPRYWRQAADAARKLHELQPANLDYEVDLATALEELGEYEEAIPFWRDARVKAEGAVGFWRARMAAAGDDTQAWAEAKAASDKAREDEFNSTIHLARSYAKNGQRDHGYRVIGHALLMSPDWIRTHPERAHTVERLFDECFPDKWPDLADSVVDLLRADPGILQDEESRQAAVRLFKHWPDRQQELRRLLERSEGELRSGR